MEFSNWRLRLGRIKLLSTFAQISDHQTRYFAVAKPCNYLKSLSTHFQDWESLWILYSSVLCQPGYILYYRYESSFLPFVREKQSIVMYYFSHQFGVCTLLTAWTKPKAFQEISNVLVSNVRSGDQRKGSWGLPHTAGTVSAIHCMRHGISVKHWETRKMQWTILMGSKMKN